MPTVPSRLILFAHFDPADRIQPYVIHHLQALRQLGGRLRFVSNSALPPLELAKLEGLADAVLVRENTGLDFGMWKAALERETLADFDELVLTNSSVIGPLQPLEPIFQRMADAPCDFWGLTESGEHCPHLQSYFMVFRKAALESEAFRQFWTSVLLYRSKANIIFSYELGLSTYLEEQHLRAAVAFPLLPSAPQRSWNPATWGHRRIRRHRNPTLFYPDLLLAAGMPYVKVSLLQGGPGRLGKAWVLETLKMARLDF